MKEELVKNTQNVTHITENTTILKTLKTRVLLFK